MPKTVRQVGQLLGCSDELVKAAYIARQLPGYVLSMDGGTHFRYLMSDAAFERLERGDWEAKPKLIFANTNLVDALLDATLSLQKTLEQLQRGE